METTSRVHMNPEEAIRLHALDKNFRDKEEHVDSTVGIEVWYEEELYDAYKTCYGNALDEYNKKQKRKDRKILDDKGDAVAAYMKQVMGSKRGKKKQQVYKTNDATGEKELVAEKEHDGGSRIEYELVVSAGNTNKLYDDEGYIVYDENDMEVHPYEIPKEVIHDANKEYVATFEERNYKLHMTYAVWHPDEFYINGRNQKQFGIAHTHVGFIGCADGYERGLSVQQSITRALTQMGYAAGPDENGKWQNQYYHWTHAEQIAYEKILQKHYTKYAQKHGHYAIEHGIYLDIIHPVAGKNVANVDPNVYRGLKQHEIDSDNLKRENAKMNKSLSVKKNELQDTETRLQTTRTSLESEREALRTAAELTDKEYDAVENLKTQKRELSADVKEKEAELESVGKSLQEKQKELADALAEIESLKAQLAKIKEEKEEKEKDYKETIEKQNQEIQTQKDEIKQLKDNFETERDAYDKKLEAIDNMLDVLDREASELYATDIDAIAVDDNEFMTLYRAECRKKTNRNGVNLDEVITDAVNRKIAEKVDAQNRIKERIHGTKCSIREYRAGMRSKIDYNNKNDEISK